MNNISSISFQDSKIEQKKEKKNIKGALIAATAGSLATSASTPLGMLAIEGLTKYSKTLTKDEIEIANKGAQKVIDEITNLGKKGVKIVDADGKDVDLNSNNGFVTTYYTDDDRAAEAEYNTKTASIQVKEKRLQNDLNQVQTQQKACETEMDSVKKVLDKNIERTFKVFS